MTDENVRYTSINLVSDGTDSDVDDNTLWHKAKEKTVSYWQSFKNFLNSRGDILSLAVAFIIAKAFQAIVTSLGKSLIFHHLKTNSFL